MTEPYQPPVTEGALRRPYQSSTDIAPVPALLERRNPRAPARNLQPLHASPRPYHLLRTWLAAFGILFVAAAAWSFASPLGSAPDEPAHLDRAASLVRGELLGKPIPHATEAQKSTVTVEVPQVFASLANDVGCFQFKPAVPAGCQGPLSTSTKDVATRTYVGRYPPFYYFLVGLPTLVLVSAKGIYGARLVSGALSAAMLALAVTSLRRCRGAPLLAAGLALAATPMVLYLGSIINPTGLEIASAISAWTAAMALASEPSEEVNASAVAVLGVSIIAVMLTRVLSPLWTVFIAATFIAIGPATSVPALFRRSRVRAWFAACVVAGLVAVTWDLAADAFATEPGTPLPAGTTGPHIVVLAVERLDLLVTSSIGQFGWLSTPSPYGIIVAWLGALGTVVLVAVCLARRRGAATLLGNLLAWLVVPVALAVAEARKDGILGQGRDYMGLAVGIPIVAAVVAGQRFVDRRTTLRLATVIVTVLAACQVGDFYAALRRNTVGINGPIDAFASVANVWHPPVPAPVLVIVFTAAMVAFALVLRSAAFAQPQNRADDL